MGEIVLFALLFLLAITNSHNFCKFRLQSYNFFLIYARKICEFEPKVIIYMQLWLKLIIFLLR